MFIMKRCHQEVYHLIFRVERDGATDSIETNVKSVIFFLKMLYHHLTITFAQPENLVVKQKQKCHVLLSSYCYLII